VGKGTMIGVVCVLAGVFGCMILEGGNPAALIAPPALLLIIVGSFGAACAGTSLEGALDSLKTIGKLFGNVQFGAGEVIEKIGSYAEIARKDGALALESKIKTEDNVMLQRGLQLIVDGVPLEEARMVMIVEAKAAKTVWKKRADFFMKLGGYSPTLGVLGTVLGLINVLGQLGGDINELGHLIASAFIATFFGVFFANALFLPFSAKITAIMDAEWEYNLIIIEGVCGIGAGKSPRTLLELLAAYVPAAERDSLPGRNREAA
jgi:chemotaxis protein MotA